MKLLIIRHGDPNYAIDSLTPTGWEEAALVAERIAKLDVKAFYVSPMGRAQATASETLKKMNRSAQTLPWLREFSAGVRRADIPGISGAWDWLPRTGQQSPGSLTGSSGWRRSLSVWGVLTRRLGGLPRGWMIC